MKQHWLWLALIWLLLAVGGQPVHAQTAEQAVTMDQVNAVARELWCPLCSGVRLDTCDLKACEQMRQEIALKLAEGEDAESIKAYFLAQYGPQVLGEPPRSGFNLLAWILPIVVVGGGAIFLLVRGRSLFARPTQSTLPSSTMPLAQEDEPYARRLDEELKRYG